MMTFPRRTGPPIVDWVDYADAVHRGDPDAFAADVWPRRPAPTTTSGWSGSRCYQTYGVKCETIAMTC